MSRRDNLRVAVVGVGHLGRVHSRIYSEMEGVELVGVVDTNRAVADQVADSLSTRAFYSHRDIIGLADAASVATPTESHFPVACELLNAGIHLIIEKPITPSLEEAEELVALAKKKGVCLQVGHVERFNPAVMAVAPYIRSPRFIECDRISPFSFRSIDIGVVLDLMIHDLDIVLAFVKSEPVEVEALGVAVFGEHEDMASARIRFANGCLAYLRASRISSKRLRKIRVFQPDSYITLNYAEQTAHILRRKKRLSKEQLLMLREQYPSLEEAQQYLFRNLLEIETVPIKEDEEPLRMELRSFIEAIRTGREPEVSGELGLKAMRLATRILDSIRRNQESSDGAMGSCLGRRGVR
ncbi:MAG: gfo/Idh/MocA family oxidoreductase [Planctomycetota bacterium]|nr:MAG: gfo/Idh/MocA family oxidoreductase [Planctomycetota bacterium]